MFIGMTPSRSDALLYAPVAVVLLVPLVIAVAAILYCKLIRKRKSLNHKPVPSQGSPQDDNGPKGCSTTYNGITCQYVFLTAVAITCSRSLDRPALTTQRRTDLLSSFQAIYCSGIVNRFDEL